MFLQFSLYLPTQVQISRITDTYLFIPITLTMVIRTDWAVARIFTLFTFISIGFLPHSGAQPEVAAWGNLEGIRIDGHLMAFETSMRVVGPGWRRIDATGKEKQARPRYSRKGHLQMVETRIDSLFFTASFEEKEPGSTSVQVDFLSRADTSITGVYFCITVPADDFSGARLEVINPAPITLAGPPPGNEKEYLRMPGNGVRVKAANQWVEIGMPDTGEIFVKSDTVRSKTFYTVYLPVAGGLLTKGLTANRQFTVKAGGVVDKTPVEIVIDPSKPGRKWEGLGGNFRIQNVRVDPGVIDYCLANLTVNWGRVDMPWMLWHPADTLNPIEEARKGNLHPRVRMAMEMAQKLSKKGMPVIVSAWFAPDWAIIGPRARGRGPDGQFGNPLDPSRMDKIYASITDYILYLKEAYGVETIMFSFNESDLGIDVRQTAEEHRQLIKGLGAYFRSKGLNTKMLLGDTADGNGYEFINPSLDDPEAIPYIGAVSFHSWRGWEDETLGKWAAAATRLNLPLLVGEGSIDAAAWRYPSIFREPKYALEEINLYTRILNICQPASILQWQLTADYSVLTGGGVFGNDQDPLTPTQRFWNLKQLAETPSGLAALPVECTSKTITCAAMGDAGKGVYALHLVNNGATREVAVSGLPDKIKRFEVYVTDRNRAMEEGKKLRVSDGKVTLTVDAGSFVTLVGG